MVTALPLPATIPAHDPAHSIRVVAACLGPCVHCGAPDCVYAETGGVVLSRCYACGDESRLDHRPMSCPQSGHCH